MSKEKVVFIKLSNWSDMGEASDYLRELEDHEHDNDVNYTMVYYDMAIIYCITTTENYANKYKLTDRIVKDLSRTIFRNYFVNYNPDDFG